MPYPALPPEGHSVSWVAWEGDGGEDVTIRWENEGWTIDSVLRGADVQFVLRLDAQWRVQQFMLFRDLEDPDLWLATDGRGRWGEVNGAHRTDLDGCTDIDIALTPTTDSVIVRRFPVGVGEAAETTVALVDVETLGVTRHQRRYSRLTRERWAIDHVDADGSVVAVCEIDVDHLGFVIDQPGVARRA